MRTALSGPATLYDMMTVVRDANGSFKWVQPDSQGYAGAENESGNGNVDPELLERMRRQQRRVKGNEAGVDYWAKFIVTKPSRNHTSR